MELNSYLVEIKTACITAYDLLTKDRKNTLPFRIISGLILECGTCTSLYTRGTSIIAYLPGSLNSEILTDGDQMSIHIPELFLLKKPVEISFENVVVGVASALRVLTALHYSLGVLEGESILIIGSPDLIPIHIGNSLGLHTYFYGKDDPKARSFHIQDFPMSLLQDTGGLGVNHILDFSLFHTNEIKMNIINSLGIRGK